MSTNTLRFIYDREVASQSGTIKIYDATNTLLKTINSNDPYVNYNFTANNETKVEADIASLGITWTKNTTYNITVDAGFVQEVGNNKSLSPAQSITYVTPNEPFVESTVPANNGTNVLAFTIQLIFDESVIQTTGNFYVYEGATLVATIPVGSSKITYNENTVSINLDGLIALGKTYHIRADSNSLKNGFDFSFLGIANDSVLKFTTGDIAHNFTLSNPNTAIEFFGSAVDISQNYMAIASSGDSANTTNGSIYIYNIDGTFVRTIADPGPTTTFGKSNWPFGLKITDQYVAFGSDQADPSTNPFNNIHIYNIVTGSLVRTITLPSPLPPSGTEIYYSGRSIAIDGDRLAVGEYRDSNPNAADIVYVYTISTGALVRTITRVNTDLNINTLGNLIIGLSGDNLIFDKGITANTPTLEAYIYSVSTGNLLRTIQVTSPESITHVAINSTYFIVKTNQNIRIYNLSDGSLRTTIPDSYNLPSRSELRISGNYLMSGSKLINIPNGNVLRDLAGTVDGVVITNTNCRSSIFGNKIIVGVTSADKTLIFTNPLS